MGTRDARRETGGRQALKGTTVYAVGHSTREIQEFIGILRAHNVDTLVDIRTIPKSRHNPQFNGNDLALSLCQGGIGYIHLKELGGLRRPAKDSKNTGWRNASFRGFADYMQTEGFEAGLEKLGRVAKEKRIAMMCAEGNPFRCHRSLVADALTVRGGKVRSAWVQRVVTLILSMLASFLLQLNILPLIAQEFGGHLADLPLWAAYLLTGIAIAAIAEGAVTAFNGTVTAIASIGDKPAQTPVAPAQDVRRFW